MTTEELILKCKSGDAQGQSCLVRTYAPRLMAICRRYTKDPASAQDALQETFINVFKYLHSYSGKGSFEGWMKRIAVNCSLAFAKKVHPVYFVDESPKSDLEMSKIPDVYSTLGKEEILSLMKRLPESLYLVFNLVVIEGYNHKEVGEMLGITEGSSRGSLSRARAKLIEILQSENAVQLSSTGRLMAK